MECVVSIVVVSYNTKELTLACIRSIYRTIKKIEFEIIVVDNNSHDGTVESIHNEFKQVRIISNRCNLGFAKANNQGVKISTGKYILFLNPDTELCEGTLENTLAYLEENQDAGVVGCRAILPDGRQQNTLLRFPSLLTIIITTFVPLKLRRQSRFFGRSRYIGIDLNKIQSVDVVAGCYMLIKREVIQTVGAFDDDFFMYGEESELCFRIHKAGWKIYYYPYAKFIHVGGASTKNITVAKTLMMAKGQLLLIQKTLGYPLLYLSNLMMFMRDFIFIAFLICKYIFSKNKNDYFIKNVAPTAARFRLHFAQLFRLSVPK